MSACDLLAAYAAAFLRLPFDDYIYCGGFFFPLSRAFTYAEMPIALSAERERENSSVYIVERGASFLFLPSYI